MAAPGAVEIGGFNLNDARRYFLLLIRVAFGLWLLYAGLFKWLGMNVSSDFVAGTVKMFADAKAWPPEWMLAPLAWAIAVAEPVLALLILSGWKPRLVWSLTAALMFQLTLGLSILMMPNAADNWQFIVLCAICAALSGPCMGRRSASIN